MVGPVGPEGLRCDHGTASRWCGVPPTPDRSTPAPHSVASSTRWKLTLTSTPWPVLLSLKTRKDVPDSQVQIAAAAIDSFTMRRAICGLTTKDYNRLFIQVLGAAQAAAPETVGDVIRDTLASQTADSRNPPERQRAPRRTSESELYPRLTKPRLIAVGRDGELPPLSSERGRRFRCSADAQT